MQCLKKGLNNQNNTNNNIKKIIFSDEIYSVSKMYFLGMEEKH